MSTQIAPSYNDQGQPFFYTQPTPKVSDIALNIFEPQRSETLPSVDSFRQAFDASENSKTPTGNAQVYSAEPVVVEVPVIVEKKTLNLQGAALFLLIGYFSYKIFIKKRT